MGKIKIVLRRWGEIKSRLGLVWLSGVRCRQRV